MEVFIKTYGCSFNFNDSEIMAGLIEKSKDYELVNTIEEADVVIVNSCTVKEKAENKLWRDLREIKKPIIIAGCVPEADKHNEKLKEYSVIGTYNVDKVIEVLDDLKKGKKTQLLGRKNIIRVNLPKTRQNEIVEIVPINEGCLGKCDYCKTIFARGHLKSYPIEDIVKHVRNSVNTGAKQIWLTSQDTACYGYDINTNIVKLLEEILKIPKEFKIRLGMGNPDFLPDYLDELIRVFKDPRIFKFLHIPVQSGSNNVLKNMKRNYTADNFAEIVEKFREKYPKITIATDIIVGHPNETDEDFEKTLELMHKVRPDVINVSRFWSRPNTIASKKKPLPTKTIKIRGQIMTKTYHNIAREMNKRWKGWQGKILIDEHGKYDGFVGRNYAYKPVIVKGDLKIGQEIEVLIKDTTVHDLRGEIL